MEKSWNDINWRALSPREQAAELNVLPRDAWKITRAENWYDQFAAHKAFDAVSDEIRTAASKRLTVDGDCDSLSYYISLNNRAEFAAALGLADSYDEYIINGDEVLTVTGCDGSRSPSSFKQILPDNGKISFEQAKAIYTAACTIKCAKCARPIVLSHLPDGESRVCHNCAEWEGNYE